MLHGCVLNGFFFNFFYFLRGFDLCDFFYFLRFFCLCDFAYLFGECGIGKVNAALCVQVLCDCYGVTHVVNTGIAGSLSPELDI
ncbi:MAG: hypothetical protein J6Q68_02010, partial [Clostridia bacterium]|nr:hypothetical protein [Clostridia bacterium]